MMMVDGEDEEILLYMQTGNINFINWTFNLSQHQYRGTIYILGILRADFRKLEKTFSLGRFYPKLDAWPYPNIIEDG